MRNDTFRIKENGLGENKNMNDTPLIVIYLKILPL